MSTDTTPTATPPARAACVTRQDFVRHNFAWTAICEAVAYRTTLTFLKYADTETPATRSIRMMMRFHAKTAVTRARQKI